MVLPQGVPDRLFKRHGRWRSDLAKDGYVGEQVTCLQQFRFMRCHSKYLFFSVPVFVDPIVSVRMLVEATPL